MLKMLIQQPLMQAQRFLSWLNGMAASANESGLSNAFPQSAPVGIAAATPLFGDNRPWNETGKMTWVSVDDRVRGGSSQSDLEIQPHGSSLTARFHGILDTKTLGGAGFASVTTQYEDSNTTADLSSYDGILIRIAHADTKRYTFILKDDIPGRRDDGRMKSGISWEYDFYGFPRMEQDTNEPNSNHSEHYYQICIPWTKFTPTFRGREMKDSEPLKTDHIKRYSLMTRSFFAKQDGNFDITFHSIWAYSNQTDATRAGIEGRRAEQSKSNL